MSFIHAYLLGGLLLAGLPVLLHLLLRQKPKRLPFPAFRFLKARQRINQRKLQLQHLLLLLLRILVLVVLCLALARPRLFSDRLGLVTDRAVHAVLLFDTSASMEYLSSGVSRLDEARLRGRELLDEMNPGSRVAVIDAGEEVQAALLPPAEARPRLDTLRIRPATGPLNTAVERALRLLEQQPAEEDSPPRLLYIFSDRTRNCWDSAGFKPRLPEGVQVVFVDVGIESPRDLGIDRIEIVPPVVAPESRFEVRVSVRGTPEGHENELACTFDNDPDPTRTTDRRPVQLANGITREQIVFERKAPALPSDIAQDVPVQLTVRLGTRDALNNNNARQATLLVRGGRKLLTLVNTRDERRSRIWEAAHAATRHFSCEVRTFDEASKLTPRELAGYAVVALLQPTTVPTDWWPRLTAYVRSGGGLAIVPAGEELQPTREEFNKAGLSAELLPAPLERLVDAPADKPVVWDRFSGTHPLMAPFAAWVRGVDPDFAREDLRPFVRRYWKLGPLVKEALSIAPYVDADNSPALAERLLGKGRIVLFTTPLDFRFVDERRTIPWTNYWTDSSFGLVLIDRVCRYLAGEVSIPQVNFLCGEVPTVPVMDSQPPLSLTGPELAGAERNLPPPDEQGMIRIAQAVSPGNYLILDARKQVVAGFSLNLSDKESDLQRVPIEELESVLGEGSVVSARGTISLQEALSSARQPPLELLPYLMMLLLVVLTLESLLANRFYRQLPAAEPAPRPILPPPLPTGGKTP
jgi:hypothetical protein